jgi:phosphopantothenoylcysteine decarboxylase/phosphopantothenate--cysteine ligase
MASALATALYLKGADVNLIATRFDTELPTNIHKIDVTSSDEMHDYLVESVRIAKKPKLSKPTLMRDEHIHLIEKKPYLFMAAAVSDYIPVYEQSGKLKKEMLGDEWELKLKKNRDILASLDKDGITVVGFKAEMNRDDAQKNALKMLEEKALDAVCLNILENSKSFGTESNAVDFITKKELIKLPKADKMLLSFDIIKEARKLQEA